jgi:hypothetical protein
MKPQIRPRSESVVGILREADRKDPIPLALSHLSICTKCSDIKFQLLV